MVVMRLDNLDVEIRIECFRGVPRQFNQDVDTKRHVRRSEQSIGLTELVQIGCFPLTQPGGRDDQRLAGTFGELDDAGQS